MTPEIFQNTALLIAAGGSNTRFGQGQNKLLVPLEGLPVICRSLDNLLPLFDPALVLVVVPREFRQQFRIALKEAGMSEKVGIVNGGATRQQSVLNGLRNLQEPIKHVAIQDGARPFTSMKLMKACLQSVRQYGSGVAARRVTDTIKIATPDGRVISTPDRDTLWATETPQAFDLRLIRAAYERAEQEQWQTTDDAQVAELAGHTVHLVPHTENNRKITFRHDLTDFAAE